MSHPVCCSHSRVKGSRREERVTIRANPPRRRDTFHLSLSSLFPAAPFSHRIIASFSPRRLVPPSPPHSLTISPSLSLSPPPKHLSSPLSYTHTHSHGNCFSRASSICRHPPCLSCSVRHQLFCPGSVLFRADKLIRYSIRAVASLSPGQSRP